MSGPTWLNWGYWKEMTSGLSFMKGKITGRLPALPNAVDIDLDLDINTIASKSVGFESDVNISLIQSQTADIHGKIIDLEAFVNHMTVESVENMTVYYQNDGDDIVLVHRLMARLQQAMNQGSYPYEPWVDVISRKVWIDKPADIKKAADNAFNANSSLSSINDNNHLNTDWLYRYYSPNGGQVADLDSAYHTIRGTGSLMRALAHSADEIRYYDYWETGPSGTPIDTYTVSGLTKAVKKILAFEEKINAIKAKTDKIPDDLLTRLQSIATDASGANVKAGSAERSAKEAERVLKEEVKPKLEAILKQIRASCAWVLDGCCRLVKSVFGPMKECFDVSGGDQTRDSNTNITPVYESPNFGITGNMEGENPPGYTFDCPALQRPWPYWPLSIDPNDRDGTNFRSIVEDLPQAVAAYYWPSAYQGAEK